MSITPLHKVVIVGRKEEKGVTLTALQNWGGMHISEPGDVGRPRDNLVEQTLSEMHKLSERLKKAVHYLQGAQKRRYQMRAPFTRIQSQELTDLVDKILQNEENRRYTQDRIDAIRERESSLAPWGDFKFPEGDNIGGQRLWFYLLPRKHKRDLDKLDYPWQIIHQNHDQIWLVLIAQQEPPADVLPCERVHTGQLSLSELRHQRADLEVHLEDIEADRQKFTRYLNVLSNCQAQAEDITELARARQMTQSDDELFLIYGWVAATRLRELQDFCQQRALAVCSRKAMAEDNPPTLLHNSPTFAGGELLVNFYQTPSYNSWDPAVALFASFALFFAMILSDAGYAGLMLLSVMVFWKKLARRETGRRLRPLLLSIAGLSCAWGVLVGSYFGRTPDPDSWLGQLKILDLNDFNFMMALSIGCGIFHLLIANAYQVWVYWKTRRAWLHVGWMVLLVAGPLLALSWQEDGNLNRGAWVGVCLAAVLIFFNASDRKVTSTYTAVLRGLEGLKGLTDVTNLFGDVLSYLRLFALGLASSSLALTFNDLSDQAFAAEDGFGVITGLLIFFVGHTLNLLLAIVSGVVHGLRLNFIEFYKWALYGEGYPFRAFKKRELSE